MLILASILLINLNAYSRTISGLVTSDEDGSSLPGVNVMVKDTKLGTVTNINGYYNLDDVPDGRVVLVFASVGFTTAEIELKANQKQLNVKLQADVRQLNEVIVTGQGRFHKPRSNRKSIASSITNYSGYTESNIFHNTEEYAGIQENIFHLSTANPLSTFSIDVDAASYANVRRMIQYGQKPPEDAVRIEEMINYFNYDYPAPAEEHPFSLFTEVSDCPWNKDHRLVHIGMQGKNMHKSQLPPSNLVFLIDVSGSMGSVNKLPLLKSAYKMMVDQLTEKDRVAIVVYAGAAGCVLPSTPGNEKRTIKRAIDRLQSGGSTAGNAGIQLAYQIANQNYIENGNNRVILATDGDFNVGVSSTGALERIISKKRASGIFLSVLGFGQGNLKDSRMETLADKGNGNYFYIDNMTEARKVLVNQLAGTLYAIAKDVKIQVEFNPAMVKGYRLIGYENRKLNDEDFNDDEKDAGELGLGHTVTALYEIIPYEIKRSPYLKKIDELKYQKSNLKVDSEELLTLKLRYKDPGGSKSKLIETVVLDNGNELIKSSDNFKFSAAVAAFGMLLRDSEFIMDFTYSDVALLAADATGIDREGYRKEFIRMVESMELMASK